MSVHTKTFSGRDILPYLDHLAQLRIEVFNEWPYLYKGSLPYERDYLATFTRAEDSVLVIAFDGKEIVGASTGLPLRHETPNLQAPFRENGYDIDTIFYFSESVLRHHYRSRGLGKTFFLERETFVQQLGGYEWITFCAVVRPESHPRRPEDYRDLAGFWQKRGYQLTEMVAHISWQDIDEKEETLKPMRFWIKKISS